VQLCRTHAGRTRHAMSATATVRFTRAQFRQALLDRGVDPSTVPEPECGFEEEDDAQAQQDFGDVTASVVEAADAAADDGTEAREEEGKEQEEEEARAGSSEAEERQEQQMGRRAHERDTATVADEPSRSPRADRDSEAAPAVRDDERRPPPHAQLAKSLRDQQRAAQSAPSSAEHVAALAALDALTFGADLGQRTVGAVEEVVAYASMRVALHLDGRHTGQQELIDGGQPAPGTSIAGRAHAAGAALSRFLHLIIAAITDASTLPVHLDETPARFGTLITAALRQALAFVGTECEHGADYDMLRADVARAFATLAEVGKVYASRGGFICDAAVEHLREIRAWSTPWILSSIVAASTALFVRTTQRCTLLLGAGSIAAAESAAERGGATDAPPAVRITQDVADRLVCARATMLSVLANSQLYAASMPYDTRGGYEAAAAVSYVLIGACGALRDVMERKGGDMPLDQIGAVRLLRQYSSSRQGSEGEQQPHHDVGIVGGERDVLSVTSRDT